LFPSDLILTLHTLSVKSTGSANSVSRVTRTSISEPVAARDGFAFSLANPSLVMHYARQ
jgi:hypothetical protein